MAISASIIATMPEMCSVVGFEFTVAAKRLKEHLKKVFNQVVVLLAEQGVLNLRELTLDGTKIEANANRYTFVWGRV